MGISFVWVAKMTEVTFNYVVLVSTEEIRGSVVNVWCMQNEHSLFSPIFKKISDPEAVLFSTVQVSLQLVSIPRTFCSYFCACVCINALCDITYMFSLPVCIPAALCIVHFWLYTIPKAQGCAAHPVQIDSRVPNQMPNRKPDLMCSTLLLTVARLPWEEAFCLWLAITHWECTLKT